MFHVQFVGVHLHTYMQWLTHYHQTEHVFCVTAIFCFTFYTSHSSHKLYICHMYMFYPTEFQDATPLHY